jgi:uncharacterized protein YceH (UPF0502 family)
MMSTDPITAPEPLVLPPLNATERRVLGVLVEKAKTTPDAYPMSVNALVTGSNQKSNREPLLNLSDADVDDALLSLQQKGLVLKITGGRVIRWRHHLYETWQVNKVELAILGELLLRGPQTEGELRSRASRMEPIDDLDALRAVLRRLGERRLAAYLTPEGRRGTVVTHGFHDPQELEKLRALHGAGFAHGESEATAPAPRNVAAAPSALESHLAEVQAELAELRSQVAELRDRVATLNDQVRGLNEALGA